MSKELTYISLFSGAGIGCFGFKQEGFTCIATNELVEKRLKIQKYNHKCELDSGYIQGDITQKEIKEKLMKEIEAYKIRKGMKKLDLDVVIATPPCQGMSVANHKKKNELKRNSLVVESIKITKELQPKFFIFENVMRFLNTICTDIDGKDKSIKEAIEKNLSGQYHIHYEVVNFKNYGSFSSRTRTLVIGVHKDIKEVTPLDLMPKLHKEKTLREMIGHLPSLNKMGEIAPKDIYHGFREYRESMREWIRDIKEGESAFDNDDPHKIPHQIRKGKIVYNKKKNGDKYKRQYWDKVAPCIHTRNDILSSQNTIHPSDDRVFSIRELMLLMSIPDSFQWTDIPFDRLNSLSIDGKRQFLKAQELNIRHSIGESVPTIIFTQIAKQIKNMLHHHVLEDRLVEKIIKEYQLNEYNNLVSFIRENPLNYSALNLCKIAELANDQRVNNSAYYTRQDICYSIIKDLPSVNELKNKNSISILEPSVGVGNFLPLLIKKYSCFEKVTIDVVDIDERTLELLQALMEKHTIPHHIKIRYIHDDFLLHDFNDQQYDIVIGNPPYKKITGKKKLVNQYRKEAFNKDTNNLFAFFIEKAMRLGEIVALIVPKSLIYSPEYNQTRELIEKTKVIKINDYNEKAFKVKIETISFLLNTKAKKNQQPVEIDSYLNREVFYQKQNYIFSKEYPGWLLYRNQFFDQVAVKMNLGVFTVYRDRQIRNTMLKDQGEIRVLKSRNIDCNKIKNKKNYDKYIDDVQSLAIAKYMNQEKVVLFPNLTYYPRACFLPPNCIADGSVALLIRKEKDIEINEEHLAYLASEEFYQYYRIARNYGTRSLNIDSNSVFFIGIRKDDGNV